MDALYRSNIDNYLSKVSNEQAWRLSNDSFTSDGSDGAMRLPCRGAVANLRSVVAEWRRRFSFSNRDQAKRRIGPSDPVPFSSRKGQKLEKFFISCCAGTEDIAAEELKHPLIEAAHIEKTASGVIFRGKSMRVGYAACMFHRTAHRILHFIHKSKLPTNQPPALSLSEFASKIRNLDRYIGYEHRIGVKSSVWGCTTIKDTEMVNREIAEGIQREAEKLGYPLTIVHKGSVILDIPFYVTIYRNTIILYRDLSGPSINSRGYRRVFHPAALAEPSAAALLYMAKWHEICKKEDAVFVDPMCGSGTLLCEAALMAMQHAPGLVRRDWPFMKWPDFNESDWTALVKEAESGRRHSWNGHIIGCDIHPIAVRLGEQARDVAGLRGHINIAESNCCQWSPIRQPDLVTTNPPWGIKKRREFPRFDLISSLKQSWADLGTFLLRECKGSRVYFPCNHPFLYKSLGLRIAERRPLWMNGAHLGVYGIHLDTTESLQNHRNTLRRSPSPILRTMDDRRQEIEAALACLNVQRVQKKKKKTDEEEETFYMRKPKYSWKYRKYIPRTR